MKLATDHIAGMLQESRNERSTCVNLCVSLLARVLTCILFCIFFSLRTLDMEAAIVTLVFRVDVASFKAFLGVSVTKDLTPRSILINAACTTFFRSPSQDNNVS